MSSHTASTSRGSTGCGRRPTARWPRPRASASGSGTTSSGSTSNTRAEPVAGGAGAVGRVEREVAGRQLLERLAVGGPRQVLAEDDASRGLARPCGHDLDLGDAVGEAERGLDRLGETALDAVAEHETIDDDLDGVLLVALELEVDRRRPSSISSPSTMRAGETLPGEVLRAACRRCPCGPAPPAPAPGSGCPRLQLEDRSTICWGVWRTSSLAGLGVVGDADAGEEQAQVVVDLGDGADRRARVARRALLVDRDGRATGPR